MDDRQLGWERVVGPVGGALLAAATLVVVSGVAGAIALNDRVGFFGFTPLTPGAITGGAIVGAPPWRDRVEIVVQQLTVGTALLVLGAVVLGAFAVWTVPRTPASVRAVLRVGAVSAWTLAIASVYAVYDAFNPPGGSLLLSTSRKIANASPRAATLVLATTAAWLATYALASRGEPVPSAGDEPAPVDLTP